MRQGESERLWVLGSMVGLGMATGVVGVRLPPQEPPSLPAGMHEGPGGAAGIEQMGTSVGWVGRPEREVEGEHRLAALVPLARVSVAAHTRPCAAFPQLTPADPSCASSACAPHPPTPCVLIITWLASQGSSSAYSPLGRRCELAW